MRVYEKGRPHPAIIWIHCRRILVDPKAAGCVHRLRSVPTGWLTIYACCSTEHDSKD
jgi:hypothetical protein